MPLTVRPLHPTVAAEVSGVDIAAGVDAATAAELEAASDRYPVLVLPCQKRRANAARNALAVTMRENAKRIQLSHADRAKIHPTLPASRRLCYRQFHGLQFQEVATKPDAA